MSEPVNTPVGEREQLVRNIYHSSQYSYSKGLKENCLYPGHRHESRVKPGRHRCHISIQRLCFGRWKGVIESALATKTDQQTLIGFLTGKAALISEQGFELQPAAHGKNPFHAHIYIPELDIPFSNEGKEADKIFQSSVRRKLDELRDALDFFTLEDVQHTDVCRECLKESQDRE